MCLLLSCFLIYLFLMCRMLLGVCGLDSCRIECLLCVLRLWIVLVMWMLGMYMILLRCRSVDCLLSFNV